MEKLQIKKAYDEFEIAGKVYVLNYSDEKIKSYVKEFDELSKEAAKTNEADVDKSRDLAIRMVDLLFHKGAGDELYEVCGKSTYSLMDIVFSIVPHMNKTIEELKETKAKEYTE